MYASDLARKDEDSSILLQRPVAFAVNCAGKLHPFVGFVFQPAQIIFVIRIVTYHHQRPVAAHLAPCIEHELRIVLGLEPTDIKNISSWLEIEAIQLMIA